MNNVDVSIVVISYNSENTILQTLDSISAQDFDLLKIELIISDDCSYDSTVDKVKNWAIHNKKFNRILILEDKINRGISANCNKGWKIAKGVWIKTIAADDILKKDCITKNMNFIKSHPSSKVVFSNLIKFTDSPKNGKLVKEDYYFFSQPSNKQHELLMQRNWIYAPSNFLEKDTLESVGYADENYPMIDDYPLWCRLTEKGIKLDFFDSATVCYRIGDTTSNQKEKIGNLKYIQSLYDFQRNYIWKNIPKFMILKKWDDSLMYYEKYIGIHFLGNKNNFLFKILGKIILLIRPYRWYMGFNLCKHILLKKKW